MAPKEATPKGSQREAKKKNMATRPPTKRTAPSRAREVSSHPLRRSPAQGMGRDLPGPARSRPLRGGSGRHVLLLRLPLASLGRGLLRSHGRRRGDGRGLVPLPVVAPTASGAPETTTATRVDAAELGGAHPAALPEVATPHFSSRTSLISPGPLPRRELPR